MNKFGGNFARKAPVVKLALLLTSVFTVAGCSSGEKLSREEACYIYGNSHQIFHDVYLTESEEYVQDYLNKERKNNKDFATILEYRSNQFKEFSPIEVNMVLTHACVKRYHLNTYNFSELKVCMGKTNTKTMFDCVDASLMKSHNEQNPKV